MKPMQKFVPYIMTPNTEETLKAYAEIFGGKIGEIHRGNTIPGMESNEKTANMIIHAALHFPEFDLFFADAELKDNNNCGGAKTIFGENIHLTFKFDDVEEQKVAYEKLLKYTNEKPIVPLGKAFWGDMFAMVKDKFGVFWQLKSYNPTDKNKFKDIAPYIFTTDTQAALKAYAEVFEGKIGEIHYANTIPGIENNEKTAKMVVMSTLHLRDFYIFLSDASTDDSPDFSGPNTVFGNNISLSILFNNQEEQKAVYERLLQYSQETIMPLGDAFWGGTFAMIKDKFGVVWQLSYNKLYENWK